MTPLAGYLFAVMTKWNPLEQHAPEPRAVTAARYVSIAEDVATVALERPIVDGDAARTGVLLVSIAGYESGFAARVDDCRLPGGVPGERAWSLWQVEGDHDALCGARIDAARAALVIVGTSLAVCHAEPLSFYTVGHCAAREPKARWRYRRARAWWLAHPFAEASS